MNRLYSVRFFIAATALGLLAPAAFASSHREAPAIAEDQFADNTDVYAFISPEDPSKLVVVANYVPLLIPSSGPNFYRFSDDVAYDIKFDNNGDAVTDISYRFLFTTTVRDNSTFLYNVGPVTSITDNNLNVRQVYDVFKLDRRERVVDAVAANVPVAPWHVGDRTFPNNTYETVARQAIRDEKGYKLFAGPRDEPFFVDLHVFDLLGVGGAPTTNGVNVMSIVFQVPITEVVQGGNRPAAGATGQNSVVGIHATASRQRTRVIREDNEERNRGRFIQISRLGWPLVNEVLIPLRDKDRFNRSEPQEDLSNIGSYVLMPALPGLLSAVLGLNCAPTPAGGRVDIAGLLSPNGTRVADLLRININQGQTYASSNFPNGRRLENDVTDTLLTALCNNGGPVGDGVNGNDRPFSTTFPYLASPFSGNPIP